MMVRVKLFAIAAQLAGTNSVDVPLDSPSTIRQLRIRLAEVSPALANLLPQMMFGINAEYATDAAIIPPNAEVACIPPVSGG